MNDNSNSFMENLPIGTLMRKFSIPCITSLLVAALYNIVDQIFIANAAYLGSYGNAANTAIFPLTVVALAIAVMFGDGCCTFVSLSLGRKEDESAHRDIGTSVIAVIVTSLVVTALYAIFQDPIIAMFGGTINDETFALSKEYFTWITVGIPFYMFGQALNPIIRSDGSPKFAMASTLAGAVVNIILDPIFIYVCQWGMMGAAVATILGQILTAILSAWYLFHMKAVKISKSSFAFHFNLLKKSVPLGITSLLSQISIVASMAAVNNMVQKYAALDPVFSDPEVSHIPMAVLGIVLKFFQIMISVVVGLAAGCIPIVGYNMGAKRSDRVKGILTRLMICEVAVGAVFLLIVECFPAVLLGIFGAANESELYTEFGIFAFRVHLSMVILGCVNKASFIFLQALGKAAASTILSLIREIAFGVGFTLVLPMFFGLNGVVYSMPVAEICTFVIAAILLMKTYRSLNSDTLTA
ncbi:MAG: MATE family efflux transporter [Firmicutes bacterium]|nr:MATE family efflux transporter [Bacillota bacterium]